MSTPDVPTYTILEADGQYPEQDLEDQIFNDDPTHAYKVRFEVPKDIRDEVDGLMILKLHLGEKDLELFPKLKV
ncbi:hypothetical protein LTR91_020536 [Friedmanniomyces endolithicus]|nr:hypothetical protein LTS09_007651 [Friedmanniomyces endolithicus]KAK0364452.1 hypothetical protein LTR94_010771 [Friedmanniomyces endolithicus]KAK0788438.1 hypothetical protein LTR59_009996 [Friedmanniomyces endolithicus]KAK0794316.1 hypothetical protein LTR38_009295 [Friedmanniomyces endolithicus]KAK0811910.1 hypothetical protein LTR75_005078 [Friedmanniomyces endolithicus]